jgi:hypothetical protein
MAPASLLAQRQFAVLVNLSQRQLISANKVESEKLAVDQLPLHLPADLVRQALEIVRVRPNQPPSWQLQRPAAGIGSQAIVLTAHLTTLLERDGSWRTQAVYGVRNRGQQFLAIRLPDGCNILSVFVRDEASRTVITEHNGQKLHLVALPQTSKADLSFDVKLILSGRFAEPLVVPGDLAGQVHAIPAPQVLTPAESTEFGLPVAQTLWQIELPKELLATPVTGQRTNLTWHKRDDELKSQLQSLERVRQDVAELKRVLADRDLTGSLKQQAQKNLARLGDLLESQQQQASQSGPGKESRFYFDENAKVLDDIQQLKESPPSDRQAGASSISQQRGFVIQNNADFSLLNSTAIPADKDADSKLNFYRADDARRAVLSGKLIAEESESRSRLKEQLKRQLPAVQQALPESSWADSFRRRSNEAKEGSGSGMGGGMGGAFTNGLQAGDESLSSLGVLPNAPRSPANPFTAPFGSTVPDGSVSGVLNAAVPMEGVAASPSELPQRPWGQTGGLSIEMDLPHAERILTFSKIGGGPELALRIRPRAIWLRALGLAWCAGCLLLGAWLLRRSACCWKTAAGEKNAR